MEKIISIVAPFNTPEDVSALSWGQKFKRLFIANYGTMVPTDLSAILILTLSFVGLLLLVL